MREATAGPFLWVPQLTFSLISISVLDRIGCRTYISDGKVYVTFGGKTILSGTLKNNLYSKAAGLRSGPKWGRIKEMLNIEMVVILNICALIAQWYHETLESLGFRVRSPPEAVLDLHFLKSYQKDVKFCPKSRFKDLVEKRSKICSLAVLPRSGVRGAAQRGPRQ